MMGCTGWTPPLLSWTRRLLVIVIDSQFTVDLTDYSDHLVPSWGKFDKHADIIVRTTCRPTLPHRDIETSASNVIINTRYIWPSLIWYVGA